MKTIFESVIARGGYNLTGLLARIDEYHIAGRLTNGERDALYQQARAGADASHDVDMVKKLADLEKRVAALEKGSTEPQPEPSEPPEYAPGKWYYAGDRAKFNGKVYECIAPDGAVCVWFPADYPAYWREVVTID